MYYLFLCPAVKTKQLFFTGQQCSFRVWLMNKPDYKKAHVLPVRFREYLFQILIDLAQKRYTFLPLH